MSKTLSPDLFYFVLCGIIVYIYALVEVIPVNSSIAYIFAIIFVVLALNIYFLTSRMRRDNKRRTRMTRAAVDEAKQALWRDREVARRIAREQEDALESLTLKNETLALYEEVRRRHAEEDEKLKPGTKLYDDGEQQG